MSQTAEYLKLRKQLIAKEFSRLNDMQLEAVVSVNGPLLILAGAGSGKTTVVVNRIANILRYGDAYLSNTVPLGSLDGDIDMLRSAIDDGAPADISRLAVNPCQPWQILAITFTNKAAGELKERLCGMLGGAGDEVWASTFHSTCARMLRRYGELLGYTQSFTIYDDDDQRRIMKEIQKALNIDDKMLPHRAILKEISSAKDKLMPPADYSKNMNVSDARIRQISKAYEIYQRRLKDANAMDFDDLIYNTVMLLEEHEEVRDYYKNRFKYVMVDEYQDTSVAQCRMVQLLSEGRANLCVVGDDDQSIYRFRGATIENILGFERHFPGAKTIRLEQNYRSTKNILDAANAVISNNLSRKGKNLWTAAEGGELITLHTAADEREEAKYIVDKIMDSVAEGNGYKSHAVLYRMNAQSNAIENVLLRSGIPYKVVGGFRFYERQEIRDVLAYLQVINNTADNLRLRRIISVPRRGIGDTTMETALQIADSLGLSLFEVIKSADSYPTLLRAAKKLKDFTAVIDELCALKDQLPLHELFEQLLHKTGYLLYWEQQGVAEQDRVDNINEFASTLVQFEQEYDSPTLSDFLGEVALVTDLDSLSDQDDRVVLMTLHAAKGLEFNTVFIPGMEDGVFPGNMSISGGPEDIEEERRLCYVGITRARKRLYITKTSQRMIFGMTKRHFPSRFLREISDDLLDKTGSEQPAYDDGYGGQSRKSSFGGGFGTGAGGFAGGYIKGEAPAVKSAVRPAGSRSTENDDKYKTGMRVKHKMFGEGMLLKISPMGNDALFEVAFDTAGTKRIMRNFSSLEII